MKDASPCLSFKHESSAICIFMCFFHGLVDMSVIFLSQVIGSCKNCVFHRAFAWTTREIRPSAWTSGGIESTEKSQICWVKLEWNASIKAFNKKKVRLCCYEKIDAFILLRCTIKITWTWEVVDDHQFAWIWHSFDKWDKYTVCQISFIWNWSNMIRHTVQ